MKTNLVYNIIRWPMNTQSHPEVVCQIDNLVYAELLLDFYKNDRPSNYYTITYAQPSNM